MMMVNFLSLVDRLTGTLNKITHKLDGFIPAVLNQEDLYQEALLHLWQQYQRGKLTDKTESYVLQGCYFHLRNCLRKFEVQYPMVSLDSLTEDNNILLNEKISFPSTFKSPEVNETPLIFNSAMVTKLTVREKQVLKLYIQGYTVREIGKQLGISHVRVVKLKTKLKNKLNPGKLLT